MSIIINPDFLHTKTHREITRELTSHNQITFIKVDVHPSYITTQSTLKFILCDLSLSVIRRIPQKCDVIFKNCTLPDEVLLFLEDFNALFIRNIGTVQQDWNTIQKQKRQKSIFELLCSSVWSEQDDYEREKFLPPQIES
jgi:hypothetical protein